MESTAGSLHNRGGAKTPLRMHPLEVNKKDQTGEPQRTPALKGKKSGRVSAEHRGKSWGETVKKKNTSRQENYQNWKPASKKRGRFIPCSSLKRGPNKRTQLKGTQNYVENGLGKKGWTRVWTTSQTGGQWKKRGRSLKTWIKCRKEKQSEKQKAIHSQRRL